MTVASTRSGRGQQQDDEWAEFVRQLRDATLPFDEQWRRFDEIFRGRPESDGHPLVWQPTVAHVRSSNIGQLMTRRSLTTYDDLYRWSTDDQEGFWGETIENLEIAFATPPSAVVDQSHRAKDPRWLPHAMLNCVDSSQAPPAGFVTGDRIAWRAKSLLGESPLAEIRVLSSTGEASARQNYLWLMSRATYQAPVIEYLGGTEIGGSHLTGTVVQPASLSTFTTAALGAKTVVLDENAVVLTV